MNENAKNNNNFLFKTFSASIKRFAGKMTQHYFIFKKINKLYSNFVCKLYIYIIFIIFLLIINIKISYYNKLDIK